MVKKNLKPRITLSTQFKKHSFTSGESIAVSVSCLNEQQKPKYVEIVATLLNGEKELEVLKGQTVNPGDSVFHFNPIHTTKGLKLKIVAKHSNGIENMVLPVPYCKGIAVQFGLYPEGGKLISGIKSKVAFKAVNHRGFTEDVRGILIENYDTLLEFVSTHNGMGNEDFGYILILSDPFDSVNKEFEQTKFSYPEYNQAKEILQPVRDFIPGTHIIELDEVIIAGKTKVQFRDKYLWHLDSLAKLSLCTYYVCQGGTLNCPQHDEDRSKKPIEGEVYYYMTGFKWNNNRDAYTITRSGHKTYHYPEISEEELLKMYNLSCVKAYYGKREFYQPNYDKRVERKSMIHDYRNTLLWEPTIITDENGEATIEFFCSDIITDFTGIIEGLDGSGQLGHTEFEVATW